MCFALPRPRFFIRSTVGGVGGVLGGVGGVSVGCWVGVGLVTRSFWVGSVRFFEMVLIWFVGRCRGEVGVVAARSGVGGCRCSSVGDGVRRCGDDAVTCSSVR